jgi:long-subunit acyl-CoA synthetase (AMP-forming)
MGYKLVPNVRQLLFHETIAESARLNSKNPYMFTLDSDVPDPQIQTITYEHFLTDVARIAKGLQHTIPKRRFGTAAQNLGILAKSSYSYAVHWVACLFNGWIVSTFRWC